MDERQSSQSETDGSESRVDETDGNTPMSYNLS